MSIQWIHEYQLFLFDLDGLLVNTEEIQYAAYQKMCADRGVDLGWDFAQFCQIAHKDAKNIRETICRELPQLLAQVSDWSVLYAEKKRALDYLLSVRKIELMPGVERLLSALDAATIKRCVVTNSSHDSVQLICRQNPILRTIPHWITREHYSHPKPHPEGYLKAIAQLALASDKVIGFEDSPRGVKALLETRAEPVLISTTYYPEIPELLAKGAKHYTSFDEI